MDLANGRIVSIADNIIIADGLSDCFVGEVVNINVRFGATNQGFVMNLEHKYVKIALIQGSQNYISTGNLLFRTGRNVRTRVGFNLLGLIVTPLGVTINDEDFTIPETIHRDVTFDGYSDIMGRAPSIIERASVTRPFLTGLSVIDCFIPVGCGQRELIIGDNNSGKTSLAITTILNQQRAVNGHYKL